MVKLSLLVAVGAIAAAVAYPVAEEDQTTETERELQLRQGGALAGIFGQIGTALVPLVGAIIGPILSNLASGIASAFNNGFNSISPTKEESAGSEAEAEAEAEATGLVVRIPSDSPLYAILLAHPSVEREGLPSVGPAPAPIDQKPQIFGGKYAAAFHPDTSDPAELHDDDSIAEDGSENAEEDEEEKVTLNPNVKRYPQRVKTKTEYA